MKIMDKILVCTLSLNLLTAEISASDNPRIIAPFELSDTSINLEMMQTPVYNQGLYSTCATFTATSYLEALWNLDFTISKSCLLALKPSLWGPSTISEVLDLINAFGVIDEKDCPFSYPYNGRLSKEEYLALSKPVPPLYFRNYTNTNLDAMKEFLKNNERVITLMNVNPNESTFGISFISTSSRQFDSGFYSCDLPKNEHQSRTRHLMILIGYDDTQGLLKLRNSFGKNYGEDGDIYMTYEYFKKHINSWSVIKSTLQ